uniref:non-specific serine/threonine protein kinase n=1 Tax=Cyprinus carpio TaxID=7962 RepID=A0A8C2PY68_CYPCA
QTEGYPDFCICYRIVHLCSRRTDGALVILKEIPVEQMSRDDRLAAQNECQVLKLLSHPNDKALMIAMEYAPGGTLADNMQKCLPHQFFLFDCIDIWALGCVLYELASLKRAFEAANLPALVLKIMSGTFAPISDRYSPELRQLILNMLNLDPSKRPQLNDIMAHPICIRPLLNLYTDIGNPHSTVQTGPHGRCVTGTRPRGGLSSLSSTKLMHPLPLSSVHFQSSASAAHVKHRVFSVYFGLTLPSVGSGEPTLPGAVEQMQPKFISRFLEGQSGVMIKSVSCGDLFTTCLSDRGIIMTFGSGSNGCLGHGNFNDVTQPKIVEALLGYELVQVSCGASHVLAVTSEREVFSWGRGDNGQLGLATQDCHNCPQQVSLPADFEAQRVLCGIDCSMIISTQFNKLGLDKVSGAEKPTSHCQKIVFIDIGTAHSVAVTEKGQCLSNQHGQLGCSSRRSSRVPYQVSGLQGITIAACGDAFTLAIGTEGGVYTWGKGARGRLGRKEEDSGKPKAVQLDESHPYTVTSVACCHGNTLSAVKHNV